MPSSNLKTTTPSEALNTIRENLPARLTDEGYTEEFSFLQAFLENPYLDNILETDQLLLEHASHRGYELKEDIPSIASVQDCLDALELVTDRNDLASELYFLLASPLFRSFMEAYDDIRLKNFEAQPGPLPELDPISISGGDGVRDEEDAEASQLAEESPIERDQNGLKALEGALKMVGIRKEPGEELGITVTRHDYYSDEYGDGCEIIVERIMSGSRIEQQGLLHVGDVIREVNGEPVDTPETLQKLMRQAEGTITLKVIPAARNETADTQLFVRAHFSYNPEYDALIPCKEAGLPFHSGDILQILNQNDAHWWQARHWEDAGRAGLIPSIILQERRKAFTQSAPDPADIEYKVMGCGFGRKKKKARTIYDATYAQKYEKTDLLVYEEVGRIPAFQRKVVVLLGAQGVGRRTLSERIQTHYPERYGTAKPTTSRPIKQGELAGDSYFFAGRDEMQVDIEQGNYLEHGFLHGNIYGIKLDTVRAVCQTGQTCILLCSPTALKILRTSEFMPHVIFVASPSTECMKAMYEYGRSMGFTEKWKRDEDFRKTMEESVAIERSYRHLFDWIVINDNMDACFEQIVEHLDSLSLEPQWVPVNWLY